MAKVELRDVDLTFQVRLRRQWAIKEYLLGLRFLSARNPVSLVHALRGVNATFGEGERVGIVGSNGAGKSTLLRVIAGIYPPTAGACYRQGSISSLFELHLGFEMEASGLDNIYYRGLLMGLHPRVIRARTGEIAEFSELESFLEVPVKYYSAGMMMRLAFSISTAFDPEILLLDEHLSVGDQHFQRKAQSRMHALVDRASLLVMVSHDLNALESLCQRVLWLEQGELIADGSAANVLAEYRAQVGKGTHEIGGRQVSLLRPPEPRQSTDRDRGSASPSESAPRKPALQAAA